MQKEMTEQAIAKREERPRSAGLTAKSLWLPVGMQGLMVLLLLAVAVMTGRSRSVQVSLILGALACVIPSFLCLLGYLGTGQILKRAEMLSLKARARLGLLSVVFWELVKLLLSVMLLLMAHFRVERLNWIALLVAFIVVVKTSWLAALVDHLRRAWAQKVLKSGI